MERPPPNTLPPLNLSPRYTANNNYFSGPPMDLPPLPTLPIPDQDQQGPWATLRGSSSRDEHRDTKHESSPYAYTTNGESSASANRPEESAMPSTSDFVKKLYKMLEDQNFQQVVSWGPHGDCFVVKDMNEFTKSILPRMFKHSNFASFVRQLNKYDFHKVKNTDDNQFGEQSWTFRHPDFHADRRESLENIKRKVPAQRKNSSIAPASSSVSIHQNHSASPSSSSHDALQSQVTSLTTQVSSLNSQVTSLNAQSANLASQLSAANNHINGLSAQLVNLTNQVTNLNNGTLGSNSAIGGSPEVSSHLRALDRRYQDVMTDVGNVQRAMAQQDGVMQSLIQSFLQNTTDGGKLKTRLNDPTSSGTEGNPFLPTLETQRMLFPDAARQSLFEMNEISRRAEEAGMRFDLESTPPETTSIPSAETDRPSSRLWAAAANAGILPSFKMGSIPKISRGDAVARMEELRRNKPAEALFASNNNNNEMDDTSSNSTSTPWVSSGESSGTAQSPPTHEGLQVYTVGHLMPKSEQGAEGDGSGNWSFDANSLNNEQEATPFDSQQQQKLRVRRSTFVPGWAVPPRVLLVDDDAVTRKLSSKFLQVFGCTTDVAVDGVGAVNKMNLEKYDLVLMDIVMPKLDGVSATSLIRKFDHMTPIISMTSNSKPNEIMTYYSSGMNDILPKPFTKQGLLDMLEKHLIHLKVIQQMSKVPRSIESTANDGSSSSSGRFDTNLQQTSSSSATPPPPNGLPFDNDGGRINPLAGMGLTDEMYATILQNLVNGESFPDPSGNGEKRTFEDESGDGREAPAKRGRFEVIE